MPLIKSIPEKYEDGFKELGLISEIDFSKIKECLSNAPLVSTIEKLSRIISSNKEVELLEVEIEEILSSVGSIISLIENKEIIEEIIQDIIFLCEVYELIKEEDKEIFKERISYLINSKQIYYAAKAEALINNYGNVFIQSRTLTDIRPVFDIAIEDGMKAGLIVHNLNIHYQSNEEPFHKDITLVLTTENIKSLIDVLKRAEKKELSLKSIFEKSEMKNLNENESIS